MLQDRFGNRVQNMPIETPTTWGRGELYETLCLLVIGVGIWFVGVTLGTFDYLNGLVAAYNLTDLLLLAACMGVAQCGASIRKSIILRRLMLERAAAAAQAEAIARHDGLTGLANRRRFIDAVERAHASATGDSAVLLIDLDRFKPVNDLYGHAAGNAVLCAVAERLQQLVPPGGLAARLGGDEFAMLVPLRYESEGLRRLAQTVIARIAEPVTWNQNDLKVGATVGVAAVSADHGDADAVLHAADLAMYQGKKDGRGKFRFFRSAMDAELRARARMETELRSAIETGAIEPFYQPVVSLPEREIVGVEVLARWRHPKRGLILPGEFIKVAGNLGRLDDLDSAILKAALKDRQNWIRQGVHVPRIAVNVSAARLSDPLLIDELQRLHVQPDMLSFELLETIFLDDSEDDVFSNVAGLKAMGIDIEIDDFGSGHASIIGLVKLKPRRMKIDRQLVFPITTSREQKRLLRSIIDIAKALNIEVIAEGVETLEHAKLLTRLGCDILQGYAIAYPVPAADMLARLMQDQELDLVAP